MPESKAAVKAAIETALAGLDLPNCPGMFAMDALESLDQAGSKIDLRFKFGYPIKRFAEAFKLAVQHTLSTLSQAVGHDIAVSVDWQAVSTQAKNTQAMVTGVKNIVAIASGKGGVGKSTTTVNLAIALAHQGARVGVLDADIYGPSQAHMLGVADKRPDFATPKTMLPLVSYAGVQMISMGNLVTEQTPMVWRGPMVSGALQQLLGSTQWDDLDYLFVDMPPGTGDIQLTLSQSVPVSGAVIVTTPQDIALLDAKKGIEMFRKVSIPVLGVVENMATHICSNCGHTEAIFGEGGGNRLADDYQTDLLGRLPLAASIRLQTDDGKPPVEAEPESDITMVYHNTASCVAASLWRQAKSASQAPNISMVDD